MSTQKSHGKPATRLPRSKELKAVPAVRERTDVRDGNGRFAKGNAGGRGRGWKHAIAKMLGRSVDDLADVATSVAEDAWRLFSVRCTPAVAGHCARPSGAAPTTTCSYPARSVLMRGR